MFDASDTIDSTPGYAHAPAYACALCDSELGQLGFDRYVEVYGAAFVTFCSMKCARVARRARHAMRWSARWHSFSESMMLLVLGAGLLTPHEGPEAHPRHVLVQPPHATPAPGPEVLPPGWFGPAWPPTEASLLEALGRDAWVHPLSGPYRRMPRSDSRVFGAVRPGNRPIECRNGHCGVDLGGEMFGEQIHAVHDGVVDFVQRGLNPDRGGRFVRISHRNGTLFTQYFHLAAIPRELHRGSIVKAGDVIGLLGDSGVKESAPHLHFAMSIRTSRDGAERYIDPEPLVALWPLRVPIDGSETGLVTILADTGIPLGSAVLRGGHGRKAGKQGNGARGAAQAPPGDDEAADAPSESSSETSSESSSGSAAPEPSVED
jgi:murein DD-endopeptidase MepM/ murein hydrolase activator NlpD